MASFDFGVGLAFWLMIGSTILSAIYGIINWNKDGDCDLKSAQKWAKEEKEIEKEFE